MKGLRKEFKMEAYKLCVEFGEAWLSTIVEDENSVDHVGGGRQRTKSSGELYEIVLIRSKYKKLCSLESFAESGMLLWWCLQKWIGDDELFGDKMRLGRPSPIR